MNITITQTQFWVIAAGITMLIVAAYGLGYQASNAWTAYLVRRAEQKARDADRRGRELIAWVRENWPNELAAYEQGTAAGYQLGLDHGADLDVDEEAA